MPYLISRQQAIDSINRTLKPGECLVCRILASKGKYVLHEGTYATIALSEYPRTWGQTMILLNAHKISVSETTQEEWQELNDHVRKVTMVLETTFQPLRCYVASLGAVSNLPNTCPHLHFNVLPVYTADDKPETIFTWRNGVYAAGVEEWEELASQLRTALESVL